MRPAGYRRLLRGSFWLTANLGVGTLTGLAFWLLTARLYDRAVLGLAASLFSSVVFVNYATNMGLPTTVVRFSDEGSGAWKSIYGWALVVSVVSAVLGATAYLAIADFPGGRVVGGSGLSGVALFAIAVVGVSTSSLVDARLIAARRWHALVSKNVLIGVGRLILLFVPLHGSDSMSVFFASVSPYAVFAAAFIIVWASPRRSGLAIRPLPRHVGGVVRFSAVNYPASLLSGAPFFALPVIVLSNVSPDANATFYVAWAAASVVFLVPASIGQSLLVEGSRGGGMFGRQALLALGLAVSFMMFALIAIAVAPGLVEVVFGAAYTTSGAVLASLCLAGIPWAVTSIALAVARVRQHNAATLALTATLGLTVLPLAILLTPQAGVDGATRAWLVGHCIAAALALLYFLSWRVKKEAVGDVAVEPDQGSGAVEI